MFTNTRPQATWCFEQVRSIWLPRAWVSEIVNCTAALLLACWAPTLPLEHFALRTAIASLLAWVVACCSLHALLAAEEALLAVSTEVSIWPQPACREASLKAD